MIATDIISRTTPRSPKALAARLLVQLGAVAVMAACTYIGYHLYAVFAHMSLNRWFANVWSEGWRTVWSFFEMDPVYTMLLVPALIVALLSLGGVYLWRQQDG